MIHGKPDGKEGHRSVKMGRRYKLYAAETGVSYQYSFEFQRRVFRPEGQGPGNDYTFLVTADQHPPFTVKVFVSDRALQAWRQVHGRELDPKEQYAAAKMGLFRAFDRYERLIDQRLGIVVDETNVEELLDPLDLA